MTKTDGRFVVRSHLHTLEEKGDLIHCREFFTQEELEDGVKVILEGDDWVLTGQVFLERHVKKHSHASGHLYTWSPIPYLEEGGAYDKPDWTP